MMSIRSTLDIHVATGGPISFIFGQSIGAKNRSLHFSSSIVYHISLAREVSSTRQRNKMKIIGISAFLALAVSVHGFVPVAQYDAVAAATRLYAKYNTMEEILAKFPDDKPVVINFYDANTENEIKNDIFRAKELLKDRATLVSIKQQDYPELAAKWDCDKKVRTLMLRVELSLEEVDTNMSHIMVPI